MADVKRRSACWIRIRGIVEEANLRARENELIATYHDRAELFVEFPELQEDDLKQVLEFAAANLDDEALDIRVA